MGRPTPPELGDYFQHYIDRDVEAGYRKCRCKICGKIIDGLDLFEEHQRDHLMEHLLELLGDPRSEEPRNMGILGHLNRVRREVHDLYARMSGGVRGFE